MLNSNLKAFVRVAECGSFTKAAESLYLSPTAVMKQINALEKHLDLILLERSPAGVRLTAAGISASAADTATHDTVHTADTVAHDIIPNAAARNTGTNSSEANAAMVASLRKRTLGR